MRLNKDIKVGVRLQNLTEDHPAIVAEPRCRPTRAYVILGAMDFGNIFGPTSGEAGFFHPLFSRRSTDCLQIAMVLNVALLSQ